MFLWSLLFLSACSSRPSHNCLLSPAVEFMPARHCPQRLAFVVLFSMPEADLTHQQRAHAASLLL